MDSSHHFPLRRFQFPIRFKMTGTARLECMQLPILVPQTINLNHAADLS